MRSPQSNLFSNMDIIRLRRWLVLFFLAIAIPAGLLIQQTYSQLKWEAFHQQRLLATELTERIEIRFASIINTEQARPFTDYAFLNVAGNPRANFLQRSPISQFPVAATIPGLIGYFQVDTNGTFSTPLVPADIDNINNYGISDTELASRNALQNQIYQILSQNRIMAAPVDLLDKNITTENDESFDGLDIAEAEITSSTATEVNTESSAELSVTGRKKAKKDQPALSQAVFDQLELSNPKETGGFSNTLGATAELKLEDNRDKRQQKSKQQTRVNTPLYKTRKEVSSLPILDSIQESTERAELREDSLSSVDSKPLPKAVSFPQLTVRTFESEIDSLVFSQLDSGHFVLFRKVWRDGQRIIQGMLIEPTIFLNNIVNATFQQTGLSLSSKLQLSYRGKTIANYSGSAPRPYLTSQADSSGFAGQILYQSRLNEPFTDFELNFTINNLPPGPGVKVVALQSVILILVLISGFYLMYRLAASQIRLVRQQQDFVSAVSHELKTPLTSIRMYGEMLKQGWATDDKKTEYYNYIFDESERLSRLINNILQLARMSRNEQQAKLSRNSISELVSLLESKISSQIEHAGFKLNLSCSATGELNIDVDWFTQIILNLVDNAIKFSAGAENKTIDISCRQLQDNKIMFSIRDYGPGIKKDQMKSIFKLFYRSENEVTRETVGTGIGLSLVHQMTQAMNGTIDVINQQPGAEFRLTFPTTN